MSMVSLKLSNVHDGLFSGLLDGGKRTVAPRSAQADYGAAQARPPSSRRPAEWLGLSDRELKNRFRNTFRFFDNDAPLIVELPLHDAQGQVRSSLLMHSSR